MVAKLDTTAAPVRQIAVDKAVLPAGSSVNPTTGAVTTPLGVAVTGIIGVTLNGAPFANSGQFGLSGNSLSIDPNQITQPAVGVVDTYVVTLNNAGGGTTLVTVLVSHGSVKIDSITISNGDTTAPATTAAPAVSGTTDTATTLSVTIDENGTGYYLVQAAAAAAPDVAAVQAGTSFAMTANVAATPAIGGLTASTAYKIYFVAKDAANNVQAAVQSVDVTTTAAPDVTAPTTTAGPSVSGTTDTATTLSVTIDENGTGYYLVQAAVAAAPSVAAVQAGTAFAMTANVAATPAISGLTASTAYTVYFVAKDAANNVQAAVQSVNVTTIAAADTTPDAFAFVDQANSALSTLTESAAITVAGIDAASAISVAGGEYQINGGAWTAVAGTVTNGQTVKVRHTTSGGNSTASNTTLTIGGVSDVFTTTTVADTTAPATPATLTLTGSAGASAGYTNTTAIALAVANVADPSGVSWFVSESASAPAVGDGGWSSTKPTSFTLSAGDATKGVYVYVKDNVGNVQATGKTAAITLDTVATTTTAGPSVSGTTDTATTLSVTIDENGTGYYLVQAAAAAAPDAAAVQAGTSFAMTANVAATPAIGGLTASTAYKIYFVAKDAANNVQAAVQSVAVTTDAVPNQPPAAIDSSFDAGGNGFVIIDFSALVTDDATPVNQLVFEVMANPGQLSFDTSTWPIVSLDNTIGGFSGNTSFDYRVRDSSGLFSATRTVYILTIL